MIRKQRLNIFFTFLYVRPTNFPNKYLEVQELVLGIFLFHSDISSHNFMTSWINRSKLYPASTRTSPYFVLVSISYPPVNWTSQIHINTWAKYWYTWKPHLPSIASTLRKFLFFHLRLPSLSIFFATKILSIWVPWLFWCLQISSFIPSVTRLSFYSISHNHRFD